MTFPAASTMTAPTGTSSALSAFRASSSARAIRFSSTRNFSQHQFCAAKPGEQFLPASQHKNLNFVTCAREDVKHAFDALVITESHRIVENDGGGTPFRQEEFRKR